MSPRGLFLALPLLLIACVAGAQQPTSAALASARTARDVLRQGIEASGGLEALRAVRVVVREFSGERTDEGQGMHPRPFGAAPIASSHPRVFSARDYSRGRFVEYRQATIFGGQPLVSRTAINGGEGINVAYDYVYRMWRPLDPQAILSIRAANIRRHPEGVLLSAWNRVETLRSLGDARVDGRPHHVISFSDSDAAQVTLYFDAVSKLLARTETLGDNGALGDVSIETVYDDYRPVGKVRLPFRLIDRVGGVQLQNLLASSIQLDVPLADSLFTPPDGFTKQEDRPRAPSPLSKLADDVYLMANGYQSVFVVFSGYVLVLEAGGGSGQSAATIDNIKRVAPGKPIRYLVSTHFHYDHIAGVRPYVAEGTTIVTTADAKVAIERAIAAPHILRPDTLSRAPRAPSFELVSSDRRVFEDAGHRVEIHRMAPFPHVAEMLFAYLPKERILFVADALDIDTPGHTGTGGDDTVQLARTIEKLGLAVDKIIPVHGQPGTMEDLRNSLTRRERPSTSR